jgi:hypothetical protein
MINHARTLLLNIPGTAYMPGVLGEEYIPAYTPVKLPAYLQSARKILFGSAPDKVFLNFRAYELLSLIHNTELAEFVYALDPRVTYWPQKVSEFYQAAKKINITRVGGTNDSKIYVTGDPVADVRRGTVLNEYSVKLVNRSGDIVVVTQATATKSIINESVGPAGGILGLTPKVALPNTDISVQIADFVNPTNYVLLEPLAAGTEFLLQESGKKIALEPNTRPESLALKRRMALLDTDAVLMSWYITTYARPESAIVSCLPRLGFLGEPAFLELFGVRSDIEPYATFKNIWFDSPDPSYRLAAFVLAMIYRTNERYNG